MRIVPFRIDLIAANPDAAKEFGVTTIFVTHDQEEALSLADRIVVLRDGVVRQVGTPKELYEAPGHLDVADFMVGENVMLVVQRYDDEKLQVFGKIMSKW